MKTNVRETSLLAFRDVAVTRGQLRVIDFIAKHPGDYTRGELAKASGIPINVVCPRVLELIESGALEERPIKRADRHTGKQCFAIRLAPKQAALEFA